MASPIFFDIETGGLSGHRSSVVSISWAIPGQGVTTGIAAPTPGTWMSRWAETNVWEPVKARASLTEQQLLEQFTGVLEKAPEGTTLAGWNVGYSITPQDIEGRAKGFDIPFLLTRAEAYGLRERMATAMGRMNIRDVGQEYAVRLAQELGQYPSVIEKDLFEQAGGYLKDTRIVGSEEQMARQAAAMGRSISGWKQELIHQTVFPGIPLAAHQSEFDVQAAMRLAEHKGPIFKGPEEAARYGRQALVNKLVSSARFGGEKNKLENLLSIARAPVSATGQTLPSIEKEFMAELTTRVEQAKANWLDIELGRGFGREAGQVWAERVGGIRVKSAGLSEFANAAFKFAKRHKVGVGVGVGIAALWAMKPAGLFSGKDDEYNTIEGLKHGGYAEISRRLHSDFGSGWIRQALAAGITREAIAKKIVEGATGSGVYGISKDIFIKKALAAKSEEGFVRFLRGSQRVQGEQERFLVASNFGEGGVGKVFSAYGMETGRKAIYKTGKMRGGQTIDIDTGGGLVVGPFMRAGDPNIIEKIVDKRGGRSIDLLKEYMGQIQASSGGKLSMAHEARMQQLARQQYGEIVPEVLGVTKSGFLQEFAGQAIPKRAEAIPAMKKAQTFFEDIFEKPGEAVRHFDPHMGNVVRQGTRLRVVDWGAAALAPPMSSTSRMTAFEYLGKYFDKRIAQVTPATPTGMQEDGIAAMLRKINTDFGSPVDLLKAANRASKLYKKHIAKTLVGKGIDLKGVQWTQMVEQEAEGVAVYTMAKKEGQLLAGMSRMLGKEAVDLTQIEVGKNLPGGLGKALYEGEADILRRVGYKAGEKLTSPVSNPITARWQMQMYGSKITQAAGVDPKDFASLEQAVMNKQVTKEAFPGMVVEGAIPKRPSIWERLSILKKQGTDTKIISPQASVERTQRLQEAHTRAMVEASQNALRPGMRHRQKTGKILG